MAKRHHDKMHKSMDARMMEMHQDGKHRGFGPTPRNGNGGMPDGARRSHMGSTGSMSGMTRIPDLYDAVEMQLKHDRAGMKKVMRPSH